ncbi:hypothetical protein K457DRAFT_719871 [Linnemannia elongata AG-77]|uniref:Uncharacterized protein n=1 Tax=Linnemannia elongata AG-77 TaxID=1314771 RepID=A0A197KB09_9FUNG|nr:hypothetical protein K457DRAFT_719871 [Linnemannia elongata AG-77]
MMPLFSVFMADVHEYVGIFYQVHPMGNVAIAGKAISRLAHLKRTAGGRLGFLQGDSLAIIWNFIAKLEAQALRCVESSTIHPSAFCETIPGPCNVHASEESATKSFRR